MDQTFFCSCHKGCLDADSAYAAEEFLNMTVVLPP